MISVGAGLDTLYFNLKSEKVADFNNVTYVELDLASVVKKKVLITIGTKLRSFDRSELSAEIRLSTVLSRTMGKTK